MDFFELAAAAFQKETVEVLGRTFVVKTMTVGEKDRAEVACARSGGTNLRSCYLVACVTNEDGSPAFREAELDRIAGLPSSVMEPLVNAAIRVNKLSEADAEAVRKN